MKNCTNCKQSKSIKDFYKEKRSPDGLYAYCKKCFMDKVEDWKKKNMEKVKLYKKKSIKKWRQNNPNKTKAHAIVFKSKAVLKKAQCQNCGSKTRLHMHHPDYSQPLYVFTLCSPCHQGLHYGTKDINLTNFEP